MGNTSVKPHPRSKHRKKQVHWKAADRPAPPGKPQLVSETEITPDVVTIRWDPPRYDGGSPITGYLVEHRRYGSPHWVRATPLLVPFTELSLSGLEPGWRYQFRISAENAVGLSAPGELSELLTVTLQRSAVTTPRFIDELADAVALENEKVEFVAQFLGQPIPKIGWFKDGFEIFSSRRIRIITENDRSILTIHQSSLSDEGEIKCTATNRAGHASTKAKLTLEAPPSIRLPRQYEDGLLFELGEIVRLKVSVAGRPSPLVFWTHNNESIKNDDRREIESTDKYSSLRIDKAMRTDRGEYHIRAVNKLGEAVASFLVTVTDKPAPPGQARVVMTLGRSVTLCWNTPSDDGGCKIGNYIVEYFRIGWDVWLKAATSRQLTTTIGDLIEGSEYKFRVKAESPYGVSDPSAESDVVFIPDPKRGILTPSARSRSQPRDIYSPNHAPVAVKRKPRSQSTTRAETISSRPTTPVHFYEGGVPTRPARSKVKSPSITPEPSPLPTRRNINVAAINKNIFDRASMARDLAYGTPEIKVKKSEIDVETPLDNTPYHSEKLNQFPNTAVKSTVNVIHHQGVNAVISPDVKRRASSPVISSHLARPSSPQPLSTFIPPPSSTNIPQQRRRSPSPKPVSPTHEVSMYTRQKSPSPKPASHAFEAKIYLKEKSPGSRPTSPTVETHQRQKSPGPRSPSPPVERKRLYQRQKSPSSDPLFSEQKERSPSALPQTKTSPSPVHFLRSLRNKSPSPLRSSKSRSPSPSRFIKDENPTVKHNVDFPNSARHKNDPLSNSSEFMLVLLPEMQRGRGSASDIKFDFEENSAPPPLSLSAPELGAEPLLFEPLRMSVSSTELLHEHAMARFYEAIAAEEAELEKKLQDDPRRRKSVEVPKIQINSRDDQVIVGLERKNSFNRRLSAGLAAPQQILWAQRRHSLRNASDLPEMPENNLRRFPALLDHQIVGRSAEITELPESNLRKFPLSLDDKRDIFSARQRSESEEREEEEFEKVRAKMAAQRKEPKKNVGVVQEEDWDEMADEEEPEYEESLSESETESSEDERLSDCEMPPMYAEEEEETYHPGLMHQRLQGQHTQNDAPFEILTRPNRLPDPNFVPKPILKRRDAEEHPAKPVRKSINTNTPRQRSLSVSPRTTTNAKEARYDFESNSRQRSFSLFPQNSLQEAQREVPAMRKRGSSPTVPFRSVSAVAQVSGMAAASVGMPQPEPPASRTVQRKKSDEEVKVIVDHYSDIVRSYGQKKRTGPRVYLDADDLKAAAERQSTDDLREIARSIENLSKLEEPAEEAPEEVEVPSDTCRRRSFVMEASSALLRTVKQGVSAVLAGDQVEDDVIPPDQEVTPPTQRRGSAQVSKRRTSKPVNKLEVPKPAKKAPPSKSPTRGENWSNLRTPSPNPQGRKSSPSPMRRNSLVPPTTQVRRSSFSGVSPLPAAKPKMRETTTQTVGDDSSLPDPKTDVLLAAKQEELSAKAEFKVRSTVDYITDLAMFVVACWLYLFQNELLAIPVLLIMVYRQLKEEIRKKLPRWMLGKKKARRK